MLRLKILTGPKAGQSVTLKDGENIVGRTPQCDVVLASNGVSKQHARLTVQGDQCVVQDLNSSNGTFVNGVKIKDRILRPGDRIGFHDIVAELMIAQIGQNINQPRGGGLPQIPSGGQPPIWGGNAAPHVQQQGYYQPQPQVADHIPGHLPGPMAGPAMANVPRHDAIEKPGSFADAMKAYVDNVVLPGVYKLAEMYPMKWVLGFMLAGFAVLVTVLATIPMAQLTKEGVQKEATRRAVTLARQLAAVGEKSLTSGGEGIIRMDFALNEDGVEDAMVIAREDGHIIAPITKAHTYPSDEFTARARKYNDEYVSQISGSTIGVSVPIRGFSSEAGSSVIIAHAIIIYKMNTVDMSATVGLFARVLIISAIFGSLMFFFMYRLISQPIFEATLQVDEALRGERDTVKTKFDFDVFKTLIDNVNSALSRMGSGQKQNFAPIDKTNEASNLVRIVSDPAFALDGGGVFVQVNTAFEDLTGMRLLTVQGQSIDVLQDPGLRANLADLIEQGRNQMGSIVTSQLEFSGVNYEIDLQVCPDPLNAAEASYIFGTIKKPGAA